MKLRLLSLLLPLLLAPAVVQAQTPPPAQAPMPTVVTVRFFIDLACPYSRQAWPLVRETLRRAPDALLVVQHLPLSIHPLAMPAAVAAVAARAQDKELAFVDALMREPTPDAAAIARAATVAGMNLAAFDKTRNDPAVAAQVVREQQAGLAMGIRTTPSALINGRGLSGVPHPESLQRALQTARARALRDRADGGTAADLERIGLLRQAPEFVAALDALRLGRALEPANPSPHGCLGPRWRVPVAEGDLAFGPEAPLTVVLFLDPTHPWQLQELATLLQMQLEEAKAGRADIRIIAKLLLPESHRAWKTPTPPLALWLAAAVLTAPPKALALLRDLAGNAVRADDVEAKLAALGLDPAAVRKAADAPATTAWLQVAADLARRTEAAPGAIFVNGRRWLGHAGDDGLHTALADLRAECKSLPGKPAAVYASLVAQGRSLQDAELDLAAPEPPDALPVLPTLGKSGQPVALFVDFRSPHSRAAFFMLRRLVQSKDVPIRLTLAVIPHGAEPGKSASGEAILAATRLGKGLELAEALFNLDKPNEWPTMAAAVKKTKLDLPTLQKSAAAPEVQDALRAVWRARQRLDMRDEPVIYIGDRLYQGPLDESRLERAVRFVRDDPSPPSAPADCQP